MSVEWLASLLHIWLVPRSLSRFCLSVFKSFLLNKCCCTLKQTDSVHFFSSNHNTTVWSVWMAEFNIYYYKSQVHRFSKNLGALKILDIRQVTWSTLLTKDPQMLGATTANLVACMTWHLEFMCPCSILLAYFILLSSKYFLHHFVICICVTS